MKLVRPSKLVLGYSVHGLRRRRNRHAAAAAHLRDDGAVVGEQALADDALHVEAAAAVGHEPDRNLLRPMTVRGGGGSNLSIPTSLFW